MAEPVEKPYILTKAEERLLAVLLDPASRLRTVKENCKIARVNRDTYYAAFNKPGFERLYQAESMNLVRRDAAHMVNSLMREAKRGNVQALKIGLEMAGLYTEKHEVVTETYAEMIARIRANHKS